MPAPRATRSRAPPPAEAADAPAAPTAAVKPAATSRSAAAAAAKPAAASVRRTASASKTADAAASSGTAARPRARAAPVTSAAASTSAPARKPATKASSTSAEAAPRAAPRLTREELVAALRKAPSCDAALLREALAHLSCAHTDLLTPGVSSSAASSSDPSASQVHTAKHLVNAVLISLNDLLVAGWKAPRAPSAAAAPPARPTAATARSASGARAASRTDSTSRSSSKSAAPTTSTSARSTPPSSGTEAESSAVASLPNVHVLVDVCRVALSVLSRAGAASKAKPLEVEGVRVSLARRLVGIDLPELAIPELCELRAGVIAAYERVPVDAHAERSARTRILLFPSPGNVQSTLQPMLLDALALGATCALQLASRASLPAVLSAMREPEGALAWLRAVSEAAERSGVDRTAYAVERAISRALARLSEGEASSFLATATALDARAISLEVLLRVSDVDVDAAWDRAARVAAAHVRGAPEAERNGAFKRADNALRQVLAVTDPLKRRGAGWMRFAEIWMQLARRTGAAEAVERIAALLISSSLAEGPGSKTDAVGQEAADLQLAQSGVALTQAIVALDAAGGERAPAAALNAASGSLAQLGDLGAQASDAGRERFFRAIESLRRRALTSFEKHSTDESLLTLLRSLAKVLCAHLWSGAPASGAVKPAEVLVDAVQVLRVLASSIMDAASSPTHADASALLSQAQALCAIASLDSYERAQQAYFLASSWGALATRLYHARNAGQAVVFLEHGCSASELAESLFAADERDTTEAAEKRQDASTRRLDLLGACLRLASRHQEALDACRRALLSVRAQRWTELDRDAASKGCSTLFQADSPHDKLGHLAAAAHQVAVTHLLIAQSEDEPRSLHAMLAEAKVPAGAMGALLEHCIAALEANAHREEVPLAVQQTTAACLTVYTSARFPLRRARVLLRDLELKLLAGSHEHAALQEIAGEAESLFQVSSLDDDAGLARFRGQYGASLHLLQLLLAQRGPHGSSGQDVAKHAAEAAARFRALLSRAGAGDKASTSSDSSARALQPVAKAPRQGAPPSTPPTRKKLSVGPAGSSASRTASSSAAVQWDDLERVQLLLTVGIEASAAFGHSLATIELLKVLRRLVSTSDAGTSKDLEARICADLARAYLALGRPARAASVLASAPSTEVGPEARFRLLLARAEERCHAGALDIAVLRYEDAIAAARDIDPPAARASSWSKALERAASSERLALAAEAYGSIRFAQGGLAGAVNAAVEAVRCALRGANTVGRLSAPPKSEDSAEDATGGLLEAPAVSDPAHAPSADDVARAATPAAALKPQPRLGSLRLAVMYWRLTRAVLSGYLRASRMYAARGSARDAEAFASEAVSFSAPLPIALAASRALIVRAELRNQLGPTDKGLADLMDGMRLQGQEWVPEACAISCVEGDAISRSSCDAESLNRALESYKSGQATLQALSESFATLDALLPSPPPKGRSLPASSSSSHLSRLSAAAATPASLLPSILARLIRRQAWLMHRMDRRSESKELLEQADEMSDQDPTGFIENLLLRGRIGLRRCLKQLQTDPVLSLVPEAALSISLASSRATVKGIGGATAKSVLKRLASAEQALGTALVPEHRAQADARQLRDIMVCLAVAQTLRFTIATNGTPSMFSAALIDASAAVTLERELLDAIEQKLSKDEAASGATASWLQFAAAPAAKVLPARKAITSRSPRRRTRGQAMVDEDEAAASSDEEMLTSGPVNTVERFWHGVRDRQTASHAALQAEEAQALDLPPHWTVVTLALSRERNSLLVSRRSGARAGQGDLLFSLPIDRQSRREGEEEELHIDAALGELRDIVETSNTATHNAKDLQGLDARKEWWTHRRSLDERLRLLLESIEQRWLGAFKSVFLEPPAASESELASLRAAFDTIISRACFGSGTKGSSPVKLDAAVFECFAALPPSSTDEELEDLLHFVMDSFQFNGVPVAVDEVDFDQSVVELRSALEAFRSKASANAAQGTPAPPERDPHLFLVLDKDTCALPWESIPVLRKSAVSRIPSLAFLRDRIELSRLAASEQAAKRDAAAAQRHTLRKGPAVSQHDGSFHLGAKPNTFFLINPSGDLTATQSRFEPWLADSARGWRGIAGRAPVADEFPAALESAELVLYFGHSGAEQYARQHRLRALKRCAVTMLWGCSSGVLKEQGDFDRTGTPHNYMIAGCPALVGNLWDATDRELDGVAKSVFTKIGLMPAEAAEPAPAAAFAAAAAKAPSSRPMSLTRAVNESRDACKLPYLTGASLVAYGVPVYF